MIKLEFTKPEIDYFKEYCYFTKEEEQILDLRLKGYQIEEIKDIVHHSVPTINRRIRSIKNKIIKSLRYKYDRKLIRSTSFFMI